MNADMSQELHHSGIDVRVEFVKTVLEQPVNGKRKKWYCSYFSYILL